MTDIGLGYWGIPLAVLAGAIRVSTPFLLVSLGECLTEKSGRINLGLEGTLLMGAVIAYGTAYVTGSPWLGVIVAALVGSATGLLHAGLCNLPRVNDIAVGIGIMLFGTGLAFYIGKPLVQPWAPTLSAIELGWWSDLPQVQTALQVNPLFLLGLALAPALLWFLRNTRWGLIIRSVGDNAEAARALGYPVNLVRTAATAVGAGLAGVGGAFLSLYYPGSWVEGLSTGQGITAVALVIFARWDPMRCFYASLLFGGAGALAPALQAVGMSSGFHLINATPYFLTLALLIYSSSRSRTLAGAPGELSITR